MKIGAVQAAPVFLDRGATVDRATALIAEAGRDGVEVLAFPEGFLPGHPGWVELLPFDGRALELGAQIFAAAVEVPGPEIAAVASACGEAEVAAVLGICERLPGSTGTLFNTQVLIAADGSLAAKHQKFVPTIGERLVHAPGRTGTTNAMTLAEGRTVSGLICGENSNPLAQYATALAYPTVHAAAWPQHFSPAVPMAAVIELVSRGLAYTLKSFVLNAVTLISPEMIATYGLDEDSRSFLESDLAGGRASIVGPTGAVLAKATDPTEQIVTAEVDPAEIIRLKQVHDFAGHYNRPELFAPLFKSDNP